MSTLPGCQNPEILANYETNGRLMLIFANPRSGSKEGRTILELAKQYNQSVDQIEKSLPKERVNEYFLDLKTIDLLKENAIVK